MNRFKEPDEQWTVKTLKLQTDLPFKHPTGFTFDQNEDLIVCDTGNQLIRKINLSDGSLTITTICGTSNPNGKSGNDGTLETASFFSPYSVACDVRDGTLYVGEIGRIRRISLTKKLVDTIYSTSASNPVMFRGIHLTSDWTLVAACCDATSESSKIIYFDIHQIGMVQEMSSVSCEEHNWFRYRPNKLTFCGADLYFTTIQKSCIARIVYRGPLVSFTANESAGYQEGYINKAQFNSPAGIVADNHGNLYICDLNNHRIRKVNVDRKIVRTIAGNGTKDTIDGFNTQASFASPVEIIISKKGIFYVLEQSGNVRMMIRRSISA